jgi:hypothetical protein
MKGGSREFAFFRPLSFRICQYFFAMRRSYF